MAGAGEQCAFSSGDSVEHPVFGVGVVVSVDKQRQTYAVKFGSLTTVRTLRFGAPLFPLKK